MRYGSIRLGSQYTSNISCESSCDILVILLSLTILGAAVGMFRVSWALKYSSMFTQSTRSCALYYLNSQREGKSNRMEFAF